MPFVWDANGMTLNGHAVRSNIIILMFIQYIIISYTVDVRTGTLYYSVIM